MKTGKLSKVETYIIDGMIKDGKTPEEIAEYLDRSLNAVKKYLAKEEEHTGNTTSENVEKAQEAVAEFKKITAKDLMVNRTEDGHERTVVIMTKAASERGDAFRQSNQGRANKFYGGDVVRLSDGKTINAGESLEAPKTGPLSEDEVKILKDMMEKNKTAKQISVALNREESKVVELMKEYA